MIIEEEKKRAKFEDQIIQRFFLFACVCVYVRISFLSLFFLPLCYVTLLIHRSDFRMTKKTNYTIVGVLFTYLMINMGARKSNNASWERKKTHMCMPCREKRQYSFTFLFISFFVCLKWIYVNVLLSFFFVIFFVVLITKRINDIPNCLIQT